MALACDPTSLEKAAACFGCLTPKQQLQVQTYLLAVIAGTSTDPKVLERQAACFSCLTEKQLMEVQAYLTCIAAGGS